MVERLHRTLKASLRCHGGDDWANVLPTVLLGLRTAFKEDIQAATAEMVYGENLRLPGEFFTPSRYNPDPANFVGRLKSTMEKLRPTPTRQPNRTTCFVHEELNSCQQVFVRDDTVRNSLQPVYLGPFRVISRDDKVFTIEQGSRKRAINIDRLKPAFIEASTDTKSGGSHLTSEQLKTAAKTTTGAMMPDDRRAPVATRSGRRVRFNPRYL
ncbi:uncharacterized protein LOC111637695 [Centruroides sculpturatus]|uniref:uncharacterized protein LOC111637695 n=1 Tax=Centruroides sculpturatus TaxID=218467 RepID=UPI000C6D82C9|nr:uncharacterized protein LOC111637695 [Centruroides sculpturatus]